MLVVSGKSEVEIYWIGCGIKLTKMPIINTMAKKLIGIKIFSFMLIPLVPPELPLEPL
jgi:hypothetical protein